MYSDDEGVSGAFAENEADIRVDVADIFSIFDSRIELFERLGLMSLFKFEGILVCRVWSVSWES